MLSKLSILSMLALEASAFWRLPCRQSVTIERIDPLTNFGEVGTHVHTVHGGNRFSSSALESDLLQSTCTSCAVKQDLSAYWTPVLYFRDNSGSFTSVKQLGGMLVYYLPRGNNVTAFPPGFRMIAGDNHRRSISFSIPEKEKSLWGPEDRTEDVLREKGIGFNCLNYKEPANAALGLRSMPDDMANKCKDGLRAEIFFPSCWNGKDLDSENHRDHMAYPSLMDDGTCPDGFETRLVSLFFETIWNVNAFAGKEGSFVFSTGDPLGYGYHGDFMNAWDVDVLQQAIDTCTSLSGVIDECKIFDLQSEDEQRQCTIKPSIDEDVVGPMAALPGCNSIEFGPEPATEGGCSGDGLLSGGPVVKAPSDETSSTTKSSSTPTPTPTPTPSTGASDGDDEAAKVDDDTDYYGNDDYNYNVAPAPSAVHNVDQGANPNVVVVTVTEYTTVPGTTITIHTTPTPAAVYRRHAHHRRGHKN